MEIIAFHACEDHYSARKLEQNYFEEYKATLNSIQPLPKPKPQPIPIPKEEKIIRTCESCRRLIDRCDAMHHGCIMQLS